MKKLSMMKAKLFIITSLLISGMAFGQVGKGHVHPKENVQHGKVVSSVAKSTHDGRIISSVASSKSNGHAYGKTVHYKKAKVYKHKKYYKKGVPVKKRVRTYYKHNK